MAAEYQFDEEVKYIMKASVSVKSMLNTRSKACLIYHHVKKYLFETTVCDPLLMAAACLNLCIKNNEEEIETDTVLMAFFSFAEPGVQQSTLSTKFRTVKNALTLMESFVLRCLEFDLSQNIAHEYLIYILNDKHEDLSRINAWNNIFTMCMGMATDFYLSKDCVLYKAEDIATAVIKATFSYRGFYDVAQQPLIKNWLKLLAGSSETVIAEIIEKIYKVCHVMLNMDGKEIDVNRENMFSRYL